MLTSGQKATLKAAILADPVLNAFPNTDDGNFDLTAQKLNVLASPAFVVWQTQLTMQIARSAIVQAADQLDNLTVGKRDALLYLVRDTLDASDVNVRTAIDNLTGTQNTLKAALVAAEKRNAFLGEKILATGTGTTISPATAGWNGPLLWPDVRDARNS
jgi:hypothetical protein